MEDILVLDSPHALMTPSKYERFVPDISETELTNIRAILDAGISTPIFPVSGIMYGQNMRIFVPLVVTFKETSIVVNFFVDTNSPCSFLRKETREALGIFNNVERIAKIHGFSTPVHLSRGQFANVDIVGQDYLRNTGICATFDYDELSVVFSRRREV